MLDGRRRQYVLFYMPQSDDALVTANEQRFYLHPSDDAAAAACLNQAIKLSMLMNLNR